MSRLGSLFRGVTNLFRGQQPIRPPDSELFSGEPGLFQGKLKIAPGQEAPEFAIGIPAGMELRGPDGKALGPSGKTDSLHVFTFTSLWNTTTHTYSWRWDEAYKRCRKDALAMRRDAFLMSLFFERCYPTAQMPWHIEPDDKKNPKQMAVADYLKACIDTLPNVTDMLMTQLEHIWYGRSGNELHWTKKQVKGMPSWVTEKPTMVNGDKIQFEWDGTPQIRIYAATPVDARDKAEREIFSVYPQIQEGDTCWTDDGMMLRLNRPFWRDRYVISKHDCIDADFYESEMAGGIHGVGIRHWIYWFWWIRQEVGSYLLDFMERTGMGFTVYYYDPGNPQDLANVKNIAKQQGRNTWIVWPRAPGDTGAQKGIERIEPNTSGAQYLKDLLTHYDDYIERFVVGQTMSGGSDNESGLGGSGRAKFAKATKNYIITLDSLRLQGYLSTDFIRVLCRMNRSNCERIYGAPLDFECRWKFDIENDDPKAKLAAAKTLFDMGVTMVEDEIRSVAGFAKPGIDDKTIGGQQAMGMPGQLGGQPGSVAGEVAGAGNGQPGSPPGMFEGKGGVASPPGDSKEEEEKPETPKRYARIRAEWEERAARMGLDPEKLSLLADAIARG